MTTKALNWAYPTSDNAAKFKMSKTGCWVVQTVLRHDDRNFDPPVAVAGFATRLEAIKHGAGLPYEWDAITLHYNPDIVAIEAPPNSLIVFTKVENTGVRFTGKKVMRDRNYVDEIELCQEAKALVYSSDITEFDKGRAVAEREGWVIRVMPDSDDVLVKARALAMEEDVQKPEVAVTSTFTPEVTADEIERTIRRKTRAQGKPSVEV